MIVFLRKTIDLLGSSFLASSILIATSWAPSTWADEWSVKLNRSGQTVNRNVEIRSNGVILTASKAREMSICPNASTSQALEETHAMVRALFSQYGTYGRVIFRNHCSDTPYFLLTASNQGLKLQIDYWFGPSCMGLDEDIPEIRDLIVHLESTYLQYPDCWDK